MGVLFFSLNSAFAQEVKDTAVRLDQYGKVVKRVPLGVETRNGILVFESANQDYKLWFDFRLNIDAQASMKSEMAHHYEGPDWLLKLIFQKIGTVSWT